MELQREVTIKGIELSVILDNFNNVIIDNHDYDNKSHYYVWGFDCDILAYSEAHNHYVEVSPKLKEIILDKLCDDDNLWDELNDKYFQSLEDDYIDSKIEEMRE